MTKLNAKKIVDAIEELIEIFDTNSTIDIIESKHRLIDLIMDVSAEHDEKLKYEFREVVRGMLVETGLIEGSAEDE